MSRLVTDHLPLLAGAPNGVKKLRELILELAVRGKLVAQDSGDEPAEVLLGEIASEKAKLVADKKLKAMPPLPAVESSAIPFDLPPEWRWARLGDITNVGFTTKSGDILPENWILDLEDIEKDTSKLLHRARFVDRQSLSDKNKFNKGDVLYGKLRPYLNKVIVADEDGFCTTEILPIRCHGPWDNNYFKLAIMSPFFLAYVNGKSYGMKMPRLGTEDGRLALFPLPPLAEQNRIVAKVDELMALCDRLETRQSDAQAAHARLVDELLGSLLQARDAEDFAECWGRVKGSFDVLFTTEQSVDRLKQALVELAVMGKIVEQDPTDEHADELANRLIAAKSLATADARKQKELTAETLPPFDAPNGWAWKKLDDLLQISGGVTLGRKFGDKALVSKPYLRVANVQRGHLDLSQVKEVDIPEDEIDRYVLRAGDLLITEGGDWDKVGRTCIWNDELAECLHQNHIFRARSESDEFFVRWAELYYRSQGLNHRL